MNRASKFSLPSKQVGETIARVSHARITSRIYISLLLSLSHSSLPNFSQSLVYDELFSTTVCTVTSPDKITLAVITRNAGKQRASAGLKAR